MRNIVIGAVFCLVALPAYAVPLSGHWKTDIPMHGSFINCDNGYHAACRVEFRILEGSGQVQAQDSIIACDENGPTPLDIEPAFDVSVDSSAAPRVLCNSTPIGVIASGQNEKLQIDFTSTSCATFTAPFGVVPVPGPSVFQTTDQQLAFSTAVSIYGVSCQIVSQLTYCFP